MSLAATNEPIQQFGKYRLLKKLAQGGMAEIFLAIQHGPHAFEKVVVIKRMLPELCVSFDFVQMFLDEARVAARLDHPNIIRIYDFGDFEGQYYLAMEYVPGEDLASIVQQCKRTRTKIPVELALDLMISAAEGLHHAHEMEDGQGNPLGIVHRDVSPSNIICGYQGAVKVLDFGVARAKNNISRTSPGVRKGTPQYLAPEQALGESVDRRADIFALGLVMHELLTGNRLFQRENEHATITAIIGDDIVPPSLWRPELPADIDRVVMKAMSRSPAARYPTALEMAADMSAYLAGTDYLRGTGQMDFLTTVFGEERKREKQRLALGASPEELASGPNLAPLRDTASAAGARPATGPGRTPDRPGTGGSGPKAAVAAMTPRRSNPQLVAPSIAPLVPPVSSVPLPSSATPAPPPPVSVPAPAGKDVPSFQKLVDNGASARPRTPPGAKVTPDPIPRPAVARPSRPDLLAVELFSDLELPRSEPIGTPAPPVPDHSPARAPAPARTPAPLRGEPARPEPPRAEPVRPEPPRPEPVRPEPPRSAPVRSEPPRTEPPPSAPPGINPFAVEPAKSEPPRAELPRPEPVRVEPARAEPPRAEPPRPAPVQSPAPSSVPLSMEAPPAPAKPRRSPLPLVAAAGVGVVVIGVAVFAFGGGKGSGEHPNPTPPPNPTQTQAQTPPTGTQTPPDGKTNPPPTGTTGTATNTTKPPQPPQQPPPNEGLKVGGLKLTNLPAGATATLDGDVVSDPTKERYLPAGTHVLVVEAKGFLPFKTDVEVAVGSVKQVEVALKPQPVVPKGTVEINCQPWCQITVDKKDSGKTSPAKLTLTAGPHTLLLANPPAGLAKTIQVVVPENGVVTKVVQLEE